MNPARVSASRTLCGAGLSRRTVSEADPRVRTVVATPIGNEVLGDAVLGVYGSGDSSRVLVGDGRRGVHLRCDCGGRDVPPQGPAVAEGGGWNPAAAWS